MPRALAAVGFALVAAGQLAFFLTSFAGIDLGALVDLVGAVCAAIACAALASGKLRAIAIALAVFVAAQLVDFAVSVLDFDLFVMVFLVALAGYALVALAAARGKSGLARAGAAVAALGNLGYAPVGAIFGAPAIFLVAAILGAIGWTLVAAGGLAP